MPTDVVYLHAGLHELRAANARLPALVAHDRAGFGGDLFADGIAVVLTSMWGFRAGNRTLWASDRVRGDPRLRRGARRPRRDRLTSTRSTSHRPSRRSCSIFAGCTSVTGTSWEMRRLAQESERALDDEGARMHSLMIRLGRAIGTAVALTLVFSAAPAAEPDASGSVRIVPHLVPRHRQSSDDAVRLLQA